jgi:hypothetical protein
MGAIPYIGKQEIGANNILHETMAGITKMIVKCRKSFNREI